MSAVSLWDSLPTKLVEKSSPQPGETDTSEGRKAKRNTGVVGGIVALLHCKGRRAEGSMLGEQLPDLLPDPMAGVSPGRESPSAAQDKTVIPQFYKIRPMDHRITWAILKMHVLGPWSSAN